MHGIVRVHGPDLDSKKNWYALSQSICNCQPHKFAQNAIFKRFPEEIRRINRLNLSRENGLSPSPSCFEDGSKKSRKGEHLVYVATTFGLLAGILRQRELESYQGGFLASATLSNLITTINEVTLESNTRHSSTTPAAVEQLLAHIEARDKEILKLQEELQILRGRLRQLTDECSTSCHTEPPQSFTIRSPFYCSTPKGGPNHSDSGYDATKLSFTDSSSPNCSEIASEESIGKIKKKRNIIRRSSQILTSLEDVCTKHRESIASVLGYHFAFGSQKERDSVKDILSEIVDVVSKAKKSNGNTLEELLNDDALQKQLQSLRVPDWILLYFKLAARLPDEGWQILLNLTHLGRSGRCEDAQLLLTKNQVKAIKRLIFDIVKRTLKINKLCDVTDFDTCGVSLASVLTWAIREQRLFGKDAESLEFNIKIDGRPLGGKNQVAIGLAPINFQNKSSESATSIYPLCIANCKESRNNLKLILSKINKEKRVIKKNGIVVDKKFYNIKFTATLDYKALLLLLEKKDDEDFQLGGKGLDVEFCAFCEAMRACTEHGALADETCVTCLQSKAKIGSHTGIRDDLNFLLDEDLSHINLCALHCEMRNTEQILGSLGLFAHQVGSLKELNSCLHNYGPECTRGKDRLQLKSKPASQELSAIGRSDIKVTSFSGNTERQILKNCETIVMTGLPLDKVRLYYEESGVDPRKIILDNITYYEERKNFLKRIIEKGTFTRDYGTRQETVNLKDLKDVEDFLKKQVEYWDKEQKDVESKFVQLTLEAEQQIHPKRKRRPKLENRDPNVFASLAAELQVNFFVKVFVDWREIAETMRKKVFLEGEEEQIDIHDIKCKEWGFLLKKLFGVTLGTGDYGHLTVEHSAMLFRQFGSFREYSGQGFEASHKLHRAIFSRATNHDASGPGQSLIQILTHHYANELLRLRYMFRQARDCISSGKKSLHYRGCGWKKVDSPSLKEEDANWIMLIDWLFSHILGKDFLEYQYEPHQGTHVSEAFFPSLDYCHELWESHYDETMNAFLDGEGDILPISLLKGDPQKQWSSNQVPGGAQESSSTSSVKLEPAQSPDSCTNVHEYTKCAESTEDVPTFRAPTPTPTPQVPCFSQMTRQELANFSIPNTVFTTASNISPLYGEFHATQPISLASRLPEATVRQCTRIMKVTRQGRKPKGVCIQGYGNFDENGLLWLEKYCQLAELKAKVQEEQYWMATLDGITAEESEKIKEVLWQNLPTKPILTVGAKSVDVLSFSELCLERYIDNFTIDICVSQYIKRSRNDSVGTLFLPNDVWDWLKSDDDNYVKRKVSESPVCFPDHLSQILIPYHMSQNHWALVYIDLVNGELGFDEGMNKVPPQSALLRVKELLELIADVFPSCKYLASTFWVNVPHFCRFGMPSQLAKDRKGSTGSGSCGVAVIMAARDFICHGTSAKFAFNWSFDEMRTIRKQLMSSITKWGEP